MCSNRIATHPILEASEEHQPAELSTPFSILKDLRHPRITASRILATKSDLSQYELLPFTYYYQIIPEPQISAGEQCPSPNIKASVTPKLRPLMKRTCPYSIKPSAPDNPFCENHNTPNTSKLHPHNTPHSSRPIKFYPIAVRGAIDNLYGSVGSTPLTTSKYAAAPTIAPLSPCKPWLREIHPSNHQPSAPQRPPQSPLQIALRTPKYAFKAFSRKTLLALTPPANTTLRASVCAFKVIFSFSIRISHAVA